MLRVDIEGGAARELGFADLAALPGQIADVGTVVPGRTGGALRFRAVLAAAGVTAKRGEVTLESSDGSFSQTAPLEGLADAVLVYREGDAPLAADRGGPIRFLVPNSEECGLPGIDRCTNVKDLALVRIRPADGG